MNARLQHRATSSRVSRASTKARHDAHSQFERVRQALDGYLAKAAAARKQLLAEAYDPKLLHAWRVNLRRVTATLKDVATLSDDDDLRDVLGHLRTCREATGQCRDFDILAQETLPAFLDQHHNKSTAAAPTQDTLSERQHQVHLQAVTTLRKSSLAAVQRSWRHWAESLEPPTDRQIRHMAATAIEQRYATLIKRVAKLDGSQKRLHRLRSATKQLRYSIELYQHAFPKPASSAWLKRLADLQSHLGLAHDRMMGRKLLASVIGKKDEPTLAKPFRRWGKRSAYEASKKATQSLERLDHLTHYWRKADDKPAQRRERKKSRSIAEDSSAKRPPSTSTR